MKKAAVVIGTMAGIVCTGCGALSLGTTKVDLTPYMEVKFSGYDSYGSAWVELDSDKFEEDYGDKLKATAKGVKKHPKKIRTLNSQVFPITQPPQRTLTKCRCRPTLSILTQVQCPNLTISAMETQLK